MNTAGAEGMGSMKSQFKKADASGARFALIFGPDEVAQGQVSVKPLRAVDGQVAAQRTEALANAAQWAASLG
jgi:histidyl-tRNA synthetase